MRFLPECLQPWLRLHLYTRLRLLQPPAVARPLGGPAHSAAACPRTPWLWLWLPRLETLRDATALSTSRSPTSTGPGRSRRPLFLDLHPIRCGRSIFLRPGAHCSGPQKIITGVAGGSTDAPQTAATPVIIFFAPARDFQSCKVQRFRDFARKRYSKFQYQSACIRSAS